MKKNTKILIIVCAAALILAGLMCLLIFLPKGDGSSSGAATYDEGVKMSVTTDKDGVHQAQIQTNDKGEIDNNSYGTLMDYIPAKISKIHLENKKGTLDIKSYTPTDKNGKTSATQYTIVGYEDFDLQGGIADNIANNAASIDFTKVMTLDGSKLADYGLDKPRDTVTVTYTDKTKAIIYVGDDAPQNAGTYIKFGSNDTVYLVAKDSVSAFDYGLTDLISLTINDAASDNDNSQASSIEISGSNFSNTITLKPNSDNKNSASYVMTSPVECYANEKESSLVAGGIRGLYALTVKMVNPSSSQLSSVGLSNPYAKLKAVYPDTTVSLRASKPDGDGNVCLMKEGGNIVYTISAEKVPWVKNLHASVDGKEILRGIDLEVGAGEVHAIMGPNGSGKSTLAAVLAGNEKFTVTEGSATFLGQDLLDMPIEDRARLGLFLGFQYPVEIPGVTMANFMKLAVNEQRKFRGEEPLTAAEFLRLMREKSAVVELDAKLTSRAVNEGFSGGEKKKNEIFQMAMLDPKLAILDETDSGLDIDALRIVATGVTKLHTPQNATVVITHYQRLLDYIVPDVVHVLYKGRIIHTGDKTLALKLEKEGYDWLINDYRE